MCRGGYYGCREYKCTVSKRGYNSADEGFRTCGLRLVLSENAISEEENVTEPSEEEPIDEEESVIEITEEPIDEEEDVDEDLDL